MRLPFNIVRVDKLATGIVIAACVVGICRPSEAQLFGRRTVGLPLSRQASPGGSGVGELQGNERFIRGNRNARAFVGADVQDVSGFVGMEQGRTAGPVASAVTGIENRVERPRVNQPLRRPTSREMYHPQIELGFAAPPDGPEARALLEDRLITDLRQLASTGRLTSTPDGLPRILVSVAERTATLQGEVASAADRDLAESLVLFAPGISRVENRLQVRLPPPQPSPSK